MIQSKWSAMMHVFSVRHESNFRSISPPFFLSFFHFSSAKVFVFSFHLPCFLSSPLSLLFSHPHPFIHTNWIPTSIEMISFEKLLYASTIGSFISTVSGIKQKLHKLGKRVWMVCLVAMSFLHLTHNCIEVHWKLIEILLNLFFPFERINYA